MKLCPLGGRRLQGRDALDRSNAAPTTRERQAHTPTPPQAGASPRLRGPRPGDAAAVWELVRSTGILDLNSPYAYLLLCSDFAETCVVAERAGRIVGFVGAYRPPLRPDSVFVWQIATAREARRRGLGASLLEDLLARPGCRGVRLLEATVTPSNEASQLLFESFARRRGAPLAKQPGFGAELFPTPEHEQELRLRIGPLDPVSTDPEEP